MDRCALFVDAGYLLAAGGLLCCGTKHRVEFDCDYDALSRDMVDVAQEGCGQKILRIYWYDGAPNAVPLADHLAIAQLPNVKLRLGRLVRGEQKGVDSLIVRDLMTLARERAIATAYVVSGDEDIREGVAAAQDMGVRVALIGVPGSDDQKNNQAPTLVREADEHIVLDRDFWEPHFALRQAPAEAPEVEDPAADAERATVIGAAFADTWADAATPEELLELLGLAPNVPRELDAQLLRQGEAELGSLRERHETKKVLRDAFWTQLLKRRG